MLGYDFEITYKKWKQNTVEDSLSTKDEEVEALLCSLYIIKPYWVVEATMEQKNNQTVWMLIQNIQKDPNALDNLLWKNYSLWYKNHLYICKNSQLKQKFLLYIHTSPIRGDSVFLKSYH